MKERLDAKNWRQTVNMYTFLVYFPHDHNKSSSSLRRHREKNIGVVVFLPPGCLRPKQRERGGKTKHMTILYMCLLV